MQNIGQSAGAACVQYSTFPGAHPCREKHLTKWVAPKWSWSGLSIITSYQSLADIIQKPIRTWGLSWGNRGLHLSSSDFTERWSRSSWMLSYYSLKEWRGGRGERKSSVSSFHSPYLWGQQQQSELITLLPKRRLRACQKANFVVPKHENSAVAASLPQHDRMWVVFVFYFVLRLRSFFIYLRLSSEAYLFFLTLWKFKLAVCD